MIKRLLALTLIASVALCVGFGEVEARSALNGNFVTNTSTRGILLDGDVHWVLVHPRAEDVVVEVWNTSAKQYEFTIEAGYAHTFQTSGMDSCRVVRASTTIVDYGLSTIRNCKPSLTTKYVP